MKDIHPRFCDFSDEKPQLEGTKKKITDILNAEILITDFRIANSKYKDKEYLTIQYVHNGETNIVFTGSKVLMDQARRYEDKMPYYVSVVLRGKYYTMS